MLYSLNTFKFTLSVSVGHPCNSERNRKILTRFAIIARASIKATIYSLTLWSRDARSPALYLVLLSHFTTVKYFWRLLRLLGLLGLLGLLRRVLFGGSLWPLRLLRLLGQLRLLGLLRLLSLLEILSISQTAKQGNCQKATTNQLHCHGFTAQRDLQRTPDVVKDAV